MDTSVDFIDCQCPYCGHGASFIGDLAGSLQECPECTQPLIVPRDGSPTAGAIPLPVTMPRLVLRRLQMGDWKDLLEFLGDENLYQYVNRAPMTEEAILKWLEEEQYVRLTSPGTTFCLAVEQQPEAKVIGVVYLNFIRDNDREQANVSLYISPKLQRQGFGTETMQAMLRFCFTGIFLHRVTATCDSRNTAAIRLLEKIGMRREGEFVKSVRLDGEWTNTLSYAILAEEYQPARVASPETE